MVRARDFDFPTAFYLVLVSNMHRGVRSVGIKQVGSENKQSSPSNFKAKNAWSHTSILTHNSKIKCV